jgi:hypothetical protein
MHTSATDMTTAFDDQLDTILGAPRPVPPETLTEPGSLDFEDDVADVPVGEDEADAGDTEDEEADEDEEDEDEDIEDDDEDEDDDDLDEEEEEEEEEG